MQNINIRVNIDTGIYQYLTHTIEPWQGGLSHKGTDNEAYVTLLPGDTYLCKYVSQNGLFALLM